MKKLISILALVVIAISCSEKQDVNLGSGKQVVSEHVVSNLPLSTSDVAYKSLVSSTEWSGVSQSVRDRIDTNLSPMLTTYDNSPIRTITFSLKTTNNFEALVFYTFNNKYTSVIAKSVAEGDLTRLSVTDAKDEVYYQFYVNKESKVGKISIGNDIPFNKIIAKNDLSGQYSRIELAAAPCTQSTSTFGACMKCAIAECADDWVCAVTCGVMSTSCLIGFGIGCGAAQI